ncbi:MAG: AsnC family transcriptional regulator [Sporomusa sp.]
MGAEAFITLDEFDRKVLNALQYDFAVSEQPYLDIATKLNSTEDAVLSRVRGLYAKGLIRRLGASIDSRQVGYVCVLVALKVDEELLLNVAKVVNSFSGVTHNYLREGDYNMWFTAIAPDKESLDNILAIVKATPGVEAVMPLPAKRVFKVSVKFPLAVGV